MNEKSVGVSFFLKWGQKKKKIRIKYLNERTIFSFSVEPKKVSNTKMVTNLQPINKYKNWSHMSAMGHRNQHVSSSSHAADLQINILRTTCCWVLSLSLSWKPNIIFDLFNLIFFLDCLVAWIWSQSDNRTSFG